MSIEVISPATGQPIGQVDDLSLEQVRDIAARARAAQPAWEASPIAERAEIIKRAQTWLMDHADRVRDVIRSETGKTFEDAQLELVVAAQSFGFWAAKGPKFLTDERVRSLGPLTVGKKIVVRHRPVGVVVVIGPWNYPLVNGFCDCVPALIAGNSVVHKPSEATPLTAGLVVEMLRACGLPEDVFLVATGAGETGSALIDDADFVMFTGSTATGRKIMERAAKTLTPVSLELGGKDPMIVLRDANLERAANTALFASMNNAGQVCISIERAYVEEPVYDEFVSKIGERAARLRVGAANGPGTTEVGCITTPAQMEIIDSHVRDAIAKGARVIAGGGPVPGDARCYRPTVLADADHSMLCVTEETFGPVLPIVRVNDADEAVRLANASRYGLMSSVFTQDIAEGEAIGRRLEAGSCCINDAQVSFTAFGAPMAGWKDSGVGSRHGASGIRKYCRQQTMLVNRFGQDRDPFMFPYTRRSTIMQAKVMQWIYGRTTFGKVERGPRRP